MPQLAIETFASQIFWIVIGFLIVYLFMAWIVTPGIEDTLNARVMHVDGLLNTAQKLKSDAEKLEQESNSALENAYLDSYLAESELMASFRERNIEEKGNLHNVFSQVSRSESATLAESSNEIFREMAANIDDTLLDAALEGISCFVTKPENDSHES
ncbi:F0F1 ATP synthase subunit B' [Alphaproteobacteria bacterium]|nr:F0F1 ATP synthase subunit B' [Alphaproteobacteria bacterium]